MCQGGLEGGVHIDLTSPNFTAQPLAIFCLLCPNLEVSVSPIPKSLADAFMVLFICLWSRGGCRFCGAMMLIHIGDPL